MCIYPEDCKMPTQNKIIRFLKWLWYFTQWCFFLMLGFIMCGIDIILNWIWGLTKWSKERNIKEKNCPECGGYDFHFKGCSHR